MAAFREDLKRALAAWLVVLTLALAACAANAEIVADRAPPPAPTEAPPRSRTGFVWVRGDWEWHGGAWHWREGRWLRTRGNEYEWQDGHWQKRGAQWVWHEGHWQKSAGGGGGRGRVILHDHGGH
jgi:hypothetical protein